MEDDDERKCIGLIGATWNFKLNFVIITEWKFLLKYLTMLFPAYMGHLNCIKLMLKDDDKELIDSVDDFDRFWRHSFDALHLMLLLDSFQMYI